MKMKVFEGKIGLENKIGFITIEISSLGPNRSSISIVNYE